MPGILADNDVLGQFETLVEIWQSEQWRDLWLELNYTLESFASLALPPDSPDAVIWQVCQTRQVVLVATGTRSEKNHWERQSHDSTASRVYRLSLSPIPIALSSTEDMQNASPSGCSII